MPTSNTNKLRWPCHKRSVSESEVEPSPKTIEVQISSAVSDIKSDMTAPEEQVMRDGSMEIAKKRPTNFAKTKRGGRTGTNRETRKEQRGIEPAKRRLQQERAENEAEKEKNHAHGQEKMLQENPHQDKEEEKQSTQNEMQQEREKQVGGHAERNRQDAIRIGPRHQIPDSLEKERESERERRRERENA